MLAAAAVLGATFLALDVLFFAEGDAKPPGGE
jgi:hypothetical protein